MKNIVKLLLGVILFSSVNVYAATCTGADLQKVSKAANGIKTNYTINEGKVKENSAEYEVFPSIDFSPLIFLTASFFVVVFFSAFFGLHPPKERNTRPVNKTAIIFFIFLLPPAS